MELFRLENVYLKLEETEILSGISWVISQGEKWVLFGRNGSGKSSLLQVMSGYQMATRGKIWRFGQEDGKSDLRELRSRIGLVNTWLKESMHPGEKVLDAVISGKHGWVGMYAVPEPEEKKEASYWLELVQMEDRAERLFGSLSDGEKMRVLIARAMMARPEVLILDEPCSHLDILSREFFLLSLETIANRHPEVGMLMVTHHTEDILPFFQYIHMLKGGKTFYQGDVEKGITSEVLSEVLGVGVEVIRPYGRYVCLVKPGGVSFISY
ncbi:ABC transporter ATP-binding protein [Thermospira aquatica]|uniref:ATP-binding cassette domain-containing protein n=1 Tax=Thermospira aquatica TaxID=2828656 RepID=A0AAX3BBQ0_9SPIR|nr:ATP-binding cassette domain-containing protein [Thermospira aquatica]URA09604.1 ATP-binding cassette domain-containing protein [Thermospira aquatica]